MDIKIECPCGVHYQFSVEPENGQMPTPVACPGCGIDGTAAANQFIAQTLTQNRPQPVTLPTPVPVSSTSASNPNVPRAPLPTTPVIRPRSSSGAPNISMGVIGAVVAGCIAMIAWFLVIKITHYQIGYAAWGVGILTGYGARLLYKDTSHLLGIVSGASALLAIIGGQFLATNLFLNEELDQLCETRYQDECSYAREAIKAQNDQDIRTVLAKYESDKDKQISPEQITEKQIAEFRKDEQPDLKKFLAGTPSKTEYIRRIKAVIYKTIPTSAILKESLNLFTLLWIFLGVGSAFKIAAGAS